MKMAQPQSCVALSALSYSEHHYVNFQVLSVVEVDSRDRKSRQSKPRSEDWRAPSGLAQDDRWQRECRSQIEW